MANEDGHVNHSRFVEQARRARARAIEVGDAEGVARAENHLRMGLAEDAAHVAARVAEMERLEVLRELAELGGIPRTEPEPEIPEAEL